MPLNPEALTWTGLLGKWMQFAQATLALRKEDDGERWRASVPAIINLQAVTFALAELDQLPKADHALALDKAQLLIDAATSQLHQIWNGTVRSVALDEIIEDAKYAHAVRHESSITNTCPTR